MEACHLPICRFLVRNSNGGTLGGFNDFQQALECKEVWERRYESSAFVGDVTVTIKETI